MSLKSKRESRRTFQKGWGRVLAILGGLGIFFLCEGWGGGAFAADFVTVDIRDQGGDMTEETQSGTVTKITREAVTLKDRAGLDVTLQANKIIATQYDDEPVKLQVVRTAIESSQYEEALVQLGEITDDEVNKMTPFMRQDYDFFRAYAASQLALSGSPDVTLRKAGATLNDFVKRNPDSYHFYEANRILGTILVAMSDYKNAKSFFEILGNAPWEEMKIEGSIALGNILLNEKDLEGAKRGFDEVMAAQDAPGVREQKNFAQIGLGRIAALQGDYDGGMAIFNGIVESSDPDDYVLQAKLYNAIGTTAMEAGKDKEAIIAFLHVDLLYSSASAEHVVALKNLLTLWKKQLREDRAAEVQSILRDKYKISE